MMTYSCPYDAVSTALPSMPIPSVPFVVPVYLNAQAQPFVPPTFATTTTQVQSQPFANSTSNPYSNSHVHHSYVPGMYMENNLPTIKQMRLEFMVFSGGDHVKWLSKDEQYFELNQILEDRKLAIATMCMNDKASYKWYVVYHEFPNSWQGLADFFMREFKGFNKSDYPDALARMTQIRSVEYYKEHFT